MKKKLAPALVLLAIAAVGIGGYFLGQRSNIPAVETTSPNPSVEAAPVPDAATELSASLPFSPVNYAVYVKDQYLSSGVPIYDKYKMDMTQGVNGLQKILFNADTTKGTPYLCIGVGYDDAEGYIQVMSAGSSEIGYTNANWFTDALLEDVNADDLKQLEEAQKPAQGNTGNTGNSGSGIDYSKLEGNFTVGGGQIPEDQQTHDGGESGTSFDRSEGSSYTGTISGGSKIDYSKLEGDYTVGGGQIPEDQQTHDGGESGTSKDGSEGVHYTGTISGGSKIDYSQLEGYTERENVIPEDQQIHDGGASGGFKDGSEGVHYTGTIGGG